MRFSKLRLFFLTLLLLTATFSSGGYCDDPLQEKIAPWMALFSGAPWSDEGDQAKQDASLKQSAFELAGTVDVKIDGRMQKVDLRMVRYDNESFDLALTQADYAVDIRRRADVTALALPKHNVVFLSQGEVDDKDHLRADGALDRLISSGSLVASFVPILVSGDSESVAGTLRALLGLRYDEANQSWAAQENVQITFPAKHTISLKIDETTVALKLQAAPASIAAVDEFPGMRVEQVERKELERTLARGVRRALEILLPSPQLTNPSQATRKVANGELHWVDGQRVALLHGSPEEIGQAHGALLKKEAERCIDSVLYTFGTAQTIQSGKWFRKELDSAYAQLSPFIPEDHKRETRAMAVALQLDTEMVEALNVFPEMFHCSGFALFGKATKDGKLYHGRVLDYMTAIGLQDAATTFIVQVDGKIPFANVGYAGFIGSVSGMNDRAISLGEMGGRGEGKWKGVPMATLMRRALEECNTLDDVVKLWTDSPRTCEYYYVFADGKTNQAVGVAAYPESIQFVKPGEGHELLGEGIPDAVVLSAGDRLKTLRERVQEKYGQVDAEIGQWLMSRPVAMQSNLHNVLFVPADGVLYVANADHDSPAAERPYVRLDLKEWLAKMPVRKVASLPGK